MKNLQIDSILANSGVNAEKNTWERRANVLPNIENGGHFISVKTDRVEVVITRFEESILEIIIGFSFTPVWIVEQWLGSGERGFISSRSEKDIIISWIEVGLVWVENSVTGEHLRPTEVLFQLFGKEVEKFVDIPFNQLTHTISEQSVCFSIMTGKIDDPINKNLGESFLPKFSPLGIVDESYMGTNIIREGEFKSLNIYMKQSIPEVEETEYTINEMAKNGEQITPELQDFRKFTLVKKKDNTGIIKKDYDFHIPDLIIPMLRTKGKANSISIEIELSKKSLNRYIHTMEKYKDNNKFGHLVWLTHNGGVSKMLKTAYAEVGGLGHTKMSIYEFDIPSPSMIYGLRK